MEPWPTTEVYKLDVFLNQMGTTDSELKLKWVMFECLFLVYYYYYYFNKVRIIMCLCYINQ